MTSDPLTSACRAIRSLQPANTAWLAAALHDVAALQATLDALPGTPASRVADPLEQLRRQLHEMRAAMLPAEEEIGTGAGMVPEVSQCYDESEAKVCTANDAGRQQQQTPATDAQAEDAE
jgi:hypothetical protein